MKRLLTTPAVWLWLASVCSVGLFWWGQFPVEVAPDTNSYTNFPWDSLSASLSSLRTPGYPLFLAFCRSVTPAGGDDLRFVPISHAVALVLSSWVMYWGMCRAGYSRWTASWCAITLMFGRASFKLGMVIATDSLAISVSLMATGCYLATTARRSGPLSWIGLAILTFATYLIRPAYLFLIPLWPVLCVVHDRCLLRPEAAWGDFLRRIVRYSLVTAIPFLAYCGLRWGVVGHFGLVSFGGYNTIGIAGQYLEEDMVPKLSADLQPLAREILKRRANLDQHPDYSAFNPSSDFLTMELNYNAVVWGCAAPAAKEMYHDEASVINRNLGRLSREILMQRPLQYAKWLKSNAVHGVLNMMHLTVPDRGVALCVLLAFLTHGWSLLKYRSGSIRSATPARTMLPESSPSADRQSMVSVAPSGTQSGNESSAASSLDRIRSLHMESHLLFWTAVGFASAKLLLVILVEPANSRYMTGAMVLLPAAVMVPVAQYMARIWKRC